MIYTAPKARITTNGLLSDPFEIKRGTRQGCPLSPLLFVLSLEPLAEMIRTHPNIRGITAPLTELKISLFADDILLTLIDPPHSLKYTLDTVKEFGTLSGYKINWEKSKALPLNVHCHKIHINNLPFKWSPEGMKYLGVTLKSDICDNVSFNFRNLITNIKHDLERWKSLPLTIWGRIDTLRMNVLPRITYLIVALPLSVDRGLFKEINKLFHNFIWRDKTPRVSRKKLYIDRKSGGLGLPDVYNYYLALNSRYPLSWGYGSDLRKTRWENIEHEIIN
uniref:Reverse transcriptase domain-containing protein n=1 Tax=Labrus bergylta TaxID=56723 RepID=A0A3Q3FN93_9LABR